MVCEFDPKSALNLQQNWMSQGFSQQLILENIYYFIRGYELGTYQSAYVQDVGVIVADSVG